MLLDSGYLTIYDKENIGENAKRPVYKYIQRSQHYYKEYNVGMKEAEINMQRSNELTCKARIWQDRNITTLHVAQLENGRLCEINRVWHGLDEQGQPITDLTLGKVIKNDFSGND